MSELDYYTILNVPRDASADEIKKAYRQLALKYHPDKSSGNMTDTAVKFREVKEAYEVLCNDAARERYNRNHPAKPNHNVHYNVVLGEDGAEYDDSPITEKEREALLVQAGLRAGWDDPEMDVYNELDPRRNNES